MSKKANIELSWTRSPSAGLTKRRIIITKNGEEETIEVPVEVSAYTLAISANTNVTYRTIVSDDEDNEISSETYSFVVGDGEMPLPDSELFHRNLGFFEA